MLKSFIALATGCMLTVSAAADMDWETNRLIPLQKVTVGPWDNFEASVSSDEQTVYFTRDRNQIRTIYKQNIALAETSLYIGKEGDAKNPVLDPTGQNIAFTYYKFDAQGDVCIASIEKKDIHCISDQQTIDESPFWADAEHLGYLQRKSSGLNWELLVYNTRTKQKRSIAQGAISAPAASPDGRYLLYSQALDSGNVAVRAFDLQLEKYFQPVPFELPGITGHMAFSHDSEFLYFNHYLNDTNRDQVIDANDHSVIYRIPTQAWFSADRPLVPEQLTSVEYNCSFPEASTRFLYLTCAFEGSLDIYRLPLSGSVPSAWTEAQISEAHLAARSYEDRLLLLNTLRYRLQKDDVHMLERLLSDHLEIGEFTAASYYLQKLESIYRDHGNAKLADFYHTLGQIVKVRSSKQKVPVNMVTAEFRRLVDDTGREIHAREGWAELTLVAEAYLAYELEHYEQALEKLDAIDLAGPMLPLERYLVFELYRKLLQENKPGLLLQLYPLMFREPGLTEEARLYYAFNYLKLLSRIETDMQARVDEITRMAESPAQSKVAALFRAELSSLQLAASQEPARQGEYFKQLSDLLKQNGEDLLLRKAMHTRAIQILGAAEQFQYMELLSRHWLVTTHISEMEFANVAEQYAVITMDKGYGMMAQGELEKAYTTFYSAIRQTNDLEAHFQFVSLGLSAEINRQENLEKSYQLLNEQNLIGQNEKYVQALRLLLQSGKEGETADEALDRALELLASMRVQGLNPGMRDLLMGYIYHQKLRRSLDGYGYDKGSFMKTHYHYMMALDLGKDNGRIAAAVWENLGWLHFEVRQYALSVDFLQHRLTYPFPTIESEINLRWSLAKSYFYNNQADLAYEQSQQVLGLVGQDASTEQAYLEKAAFYAMQAEDYENAASHYRKLLNAGAGLSMHNKAKALMGYAYSLVKSNRQEEAVAVLRQILAVAPKLSPLPADNSRLLAFHPQRLQLLAYGLLARLEKDPVQRAGLLRKRIALLDRIEGKVNEYAYDESGRLSFLAKDYQHLALAYEEAKMNVEMVDAMGQALTAAQKWVEETENPTGPVIYRTLLNYLSLALLHEEHFAGNIPKKTTALAAQSVKAFEEQTYVSPLMLVQQVKLVMVLEAFQRKVLRQTSGEYEAKLNNLLQQLEARQVSLTHPEAVREIMDLRAAL